MVRAKRPSEREAKKETTTFLEGEEDRPVKVESWTETRGTRGNRKGQERRGEQRDHEEKRWAIVERDRNRGRSLSVLTLVVGSKVHEKRASERERVREGTSKGGRAGERERAKENEKELKWSRESEKERSNGERKRGKAHGVAYPPCSEVATGGRDSLSSNVGPMSVARHVSRR